MSVLEVKKLLNIFFNDNITENILIHYWELLPKCKILLDWIDIEKINCRNLSLNPNAIDFLKNNKTKIHWNYLSYNINAIDLLKDNQNKIEWGNLSLNINAIELLSENQDKINWTLLSKSPMIFKDESIPKMSDN